MRFFFSHCLKNVLARYARSIKFYTDKSLMACFLYSRTRCRILRTLFSSLQIRRIYYE